jgi:hypothetical protein
MHRNTHVNIDTHRHACRILMAQITPRLTCSHTLPPLLPWPHTSPPSLPHSLKRRELVKDARRQFADCNAAQLERPGHETRRQSALTHSTSKCPLRPSACTCMCPMHMPHAHARVHRGSHSLCICVYVYVVCVWAGACCVCECVCVCVCARAYSYI